MVEADFSLVINMSYREKLNIGTTQKEIIEVLGDPDHIKEDRVSIEWKWKSLIDDDGKEYRASIYGGVADSSFAFYI